MKFFVTGIALFAATITIRAQAPPAPLPSPLPYVASPIRKTVDDTTRRTGFTETGFTMRGGTIRQIFQIAYPSEAGDPIGAPDWLSTERFDLTVRFEGTPTAEERQAIFQEIFATQLKLKVHREQRETPVYHMVVARSDGRLGRTMRELDVKCDERLAAARRGEPVAPLPPAANGAPGCDYKVGNGTVMSGGMRLAQLAGTVKNPAGRLIVDKTGLTGFYEFTLEWAVGPLGAGGAPNDRPDIFTAFQEQLGLRLQPATAPVDVLVIDHVERPMETR